MQSPNGMRSTATLNTTLRLVYSNGGTLPKSQDPLVKTVVVQCCELFDYHGTWLSDDYYAQNVAESDYAAHFTTAPNGGSSAFAEGMWQNVVVTFDGTGAQTGFFWNGVEQDPSSLYVTQLGALPFGPISVLSLGYDAGRMAEEHHVDGTGEWTSYVPLQGDLADAQFYDYALTPQQMDSDGKAYADFLQAQTNVQTGKIGGVGHCYTGQMAVRMAAIMPDRIAAAASFHGGWLATEKPDSPHLLLGKVKARLYFGHADNDPLMPREWIDRLEKALRDWRGAFESEVYQGGAHAWTVPGRDGVYNELQAQRAFEKEVELFDATLKA